MLDILIRNGQLIDGSGAARKSADIAIDGDKIVEIGNLESANAATVINASGKVVAPGFVDLHSHADFTIPVINDADGLIHQGITTIVAGNCGLSPAPLVEESRDELITAMASEVDQLPFDQWSSFGSYLDYLERNTVAVNFMGLTGQGIVRAGVMGFTAERPTEEQMEAMQRIVAQSLDEGAIGISTGLIYPPGSYASTEELIEFTRPVGEKNGIYFSHIRGESDTLLEAIAEAIEIGKKTGAAVHISHYKAAGRDNWHKAARGLEMIDEARAEGIPVTVDMYPYLAGATGLVSILPEWAQEGGKEATLKRLQDAPTRAKLTQDMKTTGFFRIAEFDKVMISDSPDNVYDGRYIAELAVERGKTAHEWIFDALLETNLGCGMIVFMMDEENVKMQMKHPAMMIGTDASGLPFEGLQATGRPHPRSFGTFPKVLGKYVRDEKVLTLEEAIWKMSGLPAQTLHLQDRGLIKKGYHADVVIFDPLTVIDNATYLEPFQKPSGISHVLVNGKAVIENGLMTKVKPGKILRK